ncbi:MAG: LLM class flavin-dependent oxidoreductase, partial [Hamadaea sp.]|nr:LLM class flavin-dependent oxidoreductase [Hamadaea sp.]
APAAVPAQRQAPGDDGEVDVSLYFFGDYPEGTAPERYQTILDATEYADRNGLHAVWIPERHFHSFGGLFPNPSVLAAALAARTTRLRINAGSVVLPLHHPIRVAEEWSVVDNLSGGRVGLGVAPGWHANDFVFHPEHFGRHKQVMYDNLDTVRRLWRGEAVPARSGSGDDIEVKLFPRPVQQLPPFYTAIVGNPDSYREAARRDIGVITNLMTQDVAQLADNIALYRRTRAEAGLDPDAGRVVVLLHAYLGDDLDTVRAEAFEPFCAYLRSSLSLLGQVVNSLGMNIDLASTPDDDVTFLLSQAYQRYCEQRALIGTPESCQKVLDAVLAAGADEISAFIDFGLPGERVIAGLPHLDRLRRMARRPARPRVVAAGPDRTAARPDLAHGRDVPAGAADAGDTAPLSPAQRRLWLTERLYPGRPAYNEAAAIRLEGPLDVAALQGALADVVARHAPLRTVYEQRDGEPVQVVRPEVPVACPVVDCRDEDEATRQALQEESRRLFDLTHGPVFAFRLLRVSDTRHVLVASFHHIAMDGRSYAVFAQDVSQFYRARLASRPPQLPALPVTYPEHARAQAAADGRREQDVAYWRQRLQQVPPALTLPSDIARPATSSAAGASVFFDLPAELADRVRQFGRTHQVTPFSTLITAFAVALSRTSGQQDFILGTGVTHRDEQTQDLLGFFVDTVPLRFDLSGDLSFAQLAVQVQRDAADAYAHAMPFDDLVAAAAPQREPGRHPLFDIAVEYETGGAFAFDLPGVTATPLPAGLDKAPVDLIVYLSHGATVRAHVEYRTDVFDERTIQRLFDLFQRIVDAATADPARAPAELAVPHSRLAGPQTPPASDLLHELVLRQAQLHPQATAIVDGDTRWTYDMLRERAAELAKEIVVEPGQIVALALPRSPDLIAAQLAVMMSGGVFLPLDPDHPEARLRRIIADSGARLTITTTGIVTEPEPARQTHGGAWCIYTSGSTGAPKGVLVPHSAAVNVVQWHVGELGLTPADHVAHQLAVSFDANLSEIYPALAAGATLHLAPDEIRTDPAALAAWWVLHGITTAFLPAPVAELVFAQAPQVRLRTLVVGGSALRQRPPATFGARVLNAYGPTENAIVTTAGTVTPDGRGPIDIGRPIANVTVDICDAAGAPVPPGAIGEIWASGRNLGSYLDDAPFAGGRYRTGDRARLRGDGSIEHLGRVDDQVKIGGHRVEPAEVSAALTAVTGVDQAIVIARHDRGPQPYLAAYVVGADPRPLLADLPTYLHPRTWTFLPSLPLTANGKIDVTALPAPDDTAAVGPQPTTAAEREVHDAWCAQIGAASLAVDVPFVQAGGDSLAAMRVAHQLGVAPHQVLEAAGIRSLARALPQPETAAVTFQQEQMWRRQQLTPEPAAVHIALRIDLTGHLDMAALTQALNGIVSRHAPLRSWLSDREGRVVQQITPTVHVNLEVSDVEPAAVDEWCVQQGRKPFTQAPMLRAALARHGVDQSVLLLVIHHLAADGWSVLRLVGELQEAYTAAREGRPPALPPLPVTYQEYAQRQRQTPPDPDVLRYWRTQMAGAPRKLQVPTDRPRPAAGTGGAEYAFTVPALVTAELTEFARTMNTTLYPVLAAAYAVLLWRRAGVDDVVLATLYAHRSGRDLDPLIGFLAGSVPIRLRPVPGMPFTDLVRQADTAVRDAMRHQPIHPVQLYRELDPQWSAGAPAPYGDMLFLWNPGMPTLTLPGLTARLSDQPLRSARRDIATVLAPDGDHLRGAVEYAVDLFDSSTIEAFCAEYVDILATRPDGG